MNRTKFPIANIIVKDRDRSDLGDIPKLAESLQKYGLIQPIILNQDNRLVAGMRRLSAARLLGWSEVDVCYRETMSEEELKELELEEDIRRKDRTWQERVISIYKIHKLKQRQGALSGDQWGMAETGEMLGVSMASVGYAASLATEILQNPNGSISKCDGIREAIRLMLYNKEQEALKELARRTAMLTPTIPKVGTAVVGGTVAPRTDGIPVSVPVGKPELIDGTYGPADLFALDTNVRLFVPEGSVPLSSMLHNEHCIEFMKKLPDEFVDHIVTDPPYAVDIEMMDQDNPHGGMRGIDTIRETHQVDENIELLTNFIPEAYRVMKPGYCVIWCDIMNWQFLYRIATNAGFKVQRWPIVWHKMHNCLNQCAMYNFTKNFEIAMVMRKGNITLVEPCGTSVMSASNVDDRKLFGGHPFVKPIRCWEFILSKVTFEGQLVLEPFAGEGSAVLTMLCMNLRVLACEKAEHHYVRLVENVKKHFMSIDPEIKFS